MDFDLWTRYRVKIDSTQWDIDSGLTHAAAGGRTLCGVRIGKTTEQGGPWEKHERYTTRHTTSCERCKAALIKQRRFRGYW
jgi:hypothetical protein